MLLLFPQNKRLGGIFGSLFLFFVICLLSGNNINTNNIVHAVVEIEFPTSVPKLNGPKNLKEGNKLFEKGDYDRAAMHLWRAVLMQEQNKDKYTVDDCFGKFMQCFSIQGKTADGFVYIAQESIGRAQYPMAKMYLNQALAMDPDHSDGNLLKDQLEAMGIYAGDNNDSSTNKRRRTITSNTNNEDDEDDDLFLEKTPAELYEMASTHFAERNYEKCADVFEISCVRSQMQLSPSCANAVYCRNMIIDWGFNGTQFDADMKRIEQIAIDEIEQFRSSDDKNSFEWSRAMSTHPHMMLSYPLRNSTLKRYVAESAAFTEDISQRIVGRGEIKPLPADLPYTHDHQSYVQTFVKDKTKLRIGFVASGFNSKAVLYLSHDMFRFFDTTKFEVHIFSLGAPDSPQFIKFGMRGVDWRKRVKANVDVFHDVQRFQNNHIELARYIRKRDIHILMEWDGYARQGDRAQGLFALRPAPIQIWHQEYLGTSGAQFVDYLFTDIVTSPPHLAELYVEKLIYLPNHFFSKGHAVQKEVMAPTLNYPAKSTPYKTGTGSPQSNRCLASILNNKKGVPKKPSIVYCNYNKFLKNNPETVRSWIRILREVPDSMLCLLENPTNGVSYFRKFVHEAAGKTDKKTGKFIHGDGDELNNRIHFLPWQKNPFDHQRRNQDFCNVMLDSWPYNGHTTAQDSLYGGVPIVTRSDGDEMSSRVTTSANEVLGFSFQLNAYQGPKQYEDIAIRLGNNSTALAKIRKKLIKTANQRNPMHPYWDVPRYVQNFQTGLTMAWQNFLDGLPKDHIHVTESEETREGTYDDVLIENPSEGKKKKKKQKQNGRKDNLVGEL